METMSTNVGDEQKTSGSKEFSELILPDPGQLHESELESSSPRSTYHPTPLTPEELQELEEFQQLDQSQELKQEEHSQEELQKQHHEEQAAAAAELSPRSLSSASAKTNNDNEDNNDSQQDAVMNDSIVQENNGETPGLGRNRRVRQKNRYFEDFHCMNLKKGGRSKDDYDVYSSPSVSATRSSNRRSTTDNSRRDLDANAAAKTNEGTGAGDLDAGSVDPSELGDFNLRYCNKCYKRTPHDLNRKCQACLYKKVVSISKRQKTIRLKALARSDNSADGLSSKQDNNNEGEQSLATSASSSVAHTPTPSLDGSSTGRDGSGRNKRKAKSQKGRSSKQPVAATALPTLHDTEEADMDLDTYQGAPQVIGTPISNQDDRSGPNVSDKQLVSNSAAKNIATQEKHNTSGASSSGSDLTSSTISDHARSTTSSGASIIDSNCNGTSATISKQTTTTAAAAATTTSQSSSTLKLTTTLKTDEKGNKRWVVKPTKSPVENENATISKREIDQTSSQASNNTDEQKSIISAKADEPPPPPAEQQATIQSEQNKNVTFKGNTTAAGGVSKKACDTQSALMEKINGVSNKSTSQHNNIESGRNQPQLTQLDAWTPDDVAQYVSSRGFSRESELFKSQAVDGISLLLMKRTDFTYGLKMKLGPALKLFDQVCKLKREYFSLTATAS